MSLTVGVFLGAAKSHSVTVSLAVVYVLVVRVGEENAGVVQSRGYESVHHRTWNCHRGTLPCSRITSGLVSVVAPCCF